MNNDYKKPYKKQYEQKELADLMKGFSINNILKNNAYQNKPLSFEEGYALGIYNLYPYKEELSNIIDVNKTLAEKQGIAALCALHNKETYKHKDAGQQIAGICAAVFDYDISISKKSFLNPDVDFVMDNCGMGGDLYRTANVSSIAALIASSDGVPFCKHGSPGNTDSVGSSDFIEYLGINLFAEKEKVEHAIKKTNFGYTDALNTDYKSIHVQTHKSAKLAHMNDIIGPITNPLNPELVKMRLLGVNHLIEPEVVAQAYNVLNDRGVTNLEHGLFIRGFADIQRNGGMDEASLLPGGTKVAELKNGKIRVYDLFAKDFGLSETTYDKITPQGSKKEFSRRLLCNEISGPARDMILANTALIYYVAHDMPLKEGVMQADKILNSGKPYELVDEYKKITGDLQ